MPRCEWTWASRRECQADPAALADRVSGKLGWPVFVKPANAGSSVGISKAANKEELIHAMEVALHEDDKVVFERFVEGQEVECAVLGNDELLSTRPLSLIHICCEGYLSGGPERVLQGRYRHRHL